MITVRANGNIYQFPDNTSQNVMREVIDKHMLSLKGVSTITDKIESHEAGQEGYIPEALNPEPLKPLDKKTAKEILKEASGDKEKARVLAKERGYEF